MVIEISKINRIPRLLFIMLAALLLPTPSPAVQLGQPGVYLDLAHLLCPSIRPEHFLAFSDFKDNQEETITQASLEYFNDHPELVQRIRKDLDSDDVQWHLEELSHRLVYAPESRTDVAGLFTAYCHETIADLLRRTGLTNPYYSISTICDNIPDISDDKGIQAFIVQDLVQEYTAQYQFSGSSKKRIMIDLAGTITLNEVGSYSSYLQYSEQSHQWEFIRDPYTIWKSSSSNPYTVLMTPLEETLHIALRKYTEKAIIETLAHQDNPSLADIQALMENWLAVEEAIVGGLVYTLIPDVILTRIPDLPSEWITKDLETKATFHKYRYLPKGIEFVKKNGLKQSILLYSQDPAACRDLLTDPPPAST